ncbi:MAG: PHP domain-containing protein [Oscillospiraceae bacterium]|jgi:hypothetical protein|nr:PHP domain-containing protein [Oscillospiraceae bacterium]
MENGIWPGLNAPAEAERLRAARAAARAPAPARTRFTNNHIHTIYSFSPYSPTAAVWKAAQAGLCTAGLMDHDAIGGAREFLEAGRIFALPVTIGLECRADMAGTPFGGRRTNNPDQAGVSYVALHGVPHNCFEAVAAFMAPYAAARERRNRAMVPRLNALLPEGLRLDYDREIRPLSKAGAGGSVTERHILYALSGKILADQDPAGVVERALRLPLGAAQRAALADVRRPYRAYDLLGVLKASLVERFYLPAGEECPPIEALAAFCRAHRIVLAYPYLGDVRGSVTGDKKDQSFEDGYLDELAAALPSLGFAAVTYMPSRNTARQLARVQALCRRHGLFEISGEDINQPRQSFVCEKLAEPAFAHLYEAAWALIGHEVRTTKGLDDGLLAGTGDLTRRVAALGAYARALFGEIIC